MLSHSVLEKNRLLSHALIHLADNIRVMEIFWNTC